MKADDSMHLCCWSCPSVAVEAIMDSSDAHQNQMFQLLGDPKKVKSFARIVFELQQVVVVWLEAASSWR